MDATELAKEAILASLASNIWVNLCRNSSNPSLGFPFVLLTVRGWELEERVASVLVFGG